MSLLGRLGELLHVREDEVEAVLRHDEQRARSTVRMQRRGFLSATAALAAAPFVPQSFIEIPRAEFLVTATYKTSMSMQMMLPHVLAMSRVLAHQALWMEEPK